MQQSGGAWGGSLGGYHIAGARASGIGFFEDGVTAQDVDDGSTNMNPVLNAIAEVKVLTTTLPAEYGHSSGGVISVVKKSGTNQLHGLASMFGRNRPMQHRRFADQCRSDQTDQGCTPYGVFFLQPDINLNGPIYIPKVYDGRNKTFFFVGWQRLIEKKALQGTATVPTQDMKNGILTYNGNPDPIYNPFSTMQDANGNWSRQPIEGNIIPGNMINPVAKNIIGIDPWQTPNQPTSFGPTGPNNNFQYIEQSRVFFDDWTGRLDHQFNPFVKVYFSYSHNDRSDIHRPHAIKPDPLSQKFDGGSDVNPDIWRNMSVGNTWVIGPTMVNDFRVGYWRSTSKDIVPGAGENLAALVGIPNVSAELLPGMGTIYEMNGNAGISDRLGENYTIRDDFSLVKGTHALKMGYEMLRYKVYNSSENRPSGNFSLGGTNGIRADAGGINNTGNGWADFMLGAVTQLTFDRELAPWTPLSSIHSFYLQDDWKVRRNLTLNLGVRYSNEGGYAMQSGKQSNWLPTVTDPLTGNMGGFTHATGQLYTRDNNNFQPRIGLAYNFADSWVLRGGFALNTVDNKFPTGREHIEEFVGQLNYEGAPGDPTPLFRIDQNPYSGADYDVLADGSSPYQGDNYSGRNAAWVDQNLRNPYVLNWNLSIQHELSNDLLVELSYQGSGGNGLVENHHYNTYPVNFLENDPAQREQARIRYQDFIPYSHFGSVQLRSNYGHSTYHGGTIKLEKRMSKGVTFSTFYTLAKTLDSADGDNDSGGVDPLNNRNLDKGRAGWDRNHRFNFTGSYELPFGQGRAFMNSNKGMDLVFGGWELSGILTLESGAGMTWGYTRSPYNYFNGTVSDSRANLIGENPAVVDNWLAKMGASPNRFNRDQIAPAICCESSLAYPDAYQIGTAGRNTGRGLPLRQVSLSGQKNFRIHERLNAQLRLDMQNPFKMRNFGNPRSDFDPTRPYRFGTVNSDTTTASWGGQTLLNLTLAFMW
jgi:hypothetical protein